MMTKVMAEIRYDEYGRKAKRAEMAANKCGGLDVGNQEQRKWSDGKSEKE